MFNSSISSNHAVTLGQSQFQDVMFVVGSQLTPYTQLRQIELELHSLNDSIKMHEFKTRRLNIKISKLNPNDELEAIDLEEAEWNKAHTVKLLEDAINRKSSFDLMKTQLLQNVPQEYWDQGYENAELDHWTKFVAKQIGLSKALGLPPPASAVEMLLQLPEQAQYNALKLSNEDAIKIVNMDQKVVAQLESPDK